MLRNEALRSAEMAIFAAGVAEIAAMLLIRTAPSLRFVDRPGGRHTHASPTPRVGGLAIAIGIVVISLLYQYEGYNSRATIGAVAFLMIGALDDALRDRFPWMLKFAAQIAIVSWFAWPMGIAEGAVVAFFLLVIVNAYNFFDHADGLLFAALLPGFLMLRGDGSWIALGALAPVFLLNLRKKIFAGDAGSHAFSFWIAASLIGAGGEFKNRFYAVAMVGALPIVDLIVVVARRLRRGIPPWRSTPDHLQNRFAAVGAPSLRALKLTLVWAFLAWLILAFSDGSVTGDAAAFSFLAAVMVAMVAVNYTRNATAQR